MADRFNIIYSGHLSYGFTETEARQGLRQRYKFSDAQLDKLFKTPKMVLKKGVDREAGNRLISSLRETGIECDLVSTETTAPSPQLPEPPRPEPDLSAASATASPEPPLPPKTILCPKCGASQPEAEICVQCGVIFKKFQKVQDRISEGKTPRQVAAQLRGESEEKVADMETSVLERNPEKAFLARAAPTVAGILFLVNITPWLVTWFIFFFPLMFLSYVRLKAASEGMSTLDALKEHLTFIPVMYAEGERKKEGVAWLTYLLILINILIFYGYELNADIEFLQNNLLFVPVEPNLFNVPISLFTHFFLHASGGHLWGNMVALWVFGTVIERRIGWVKFGLFYTVSGVLSALLSVLIMYVTQQEVIHGLGASGAIAGIMGLFAVRCYFKSVIFPIPILGIFSLILPINLKIKLNSLILIGLFFIKDLFGGIGQALGDNVSNINHWAHLGGMAAGVGLAYLFRLGNAAVEERHLDQGLKETEGGKLSAVGEQSLRKVLETSPDNIEVLTALARSCSKYTLTDEGAELYTRAIHLSLTKEPAQATELFREFYKRYSRGLDPHTMYRLAVQFHQQNDLVMASQVLYLLSQDPQAAPEMREKALFQNARLLESLGESDAAQNCYRALLDLFPESAHRPRALAALRQN